jgi:uncharacterized protein (TIGR02145 family)
MTKDSSPARRAAGIAEVSITRARNVHKRGTPNYITVQIGDQVWMAKNLNVDRFQNGDVIPHFISVEEWKQADDNQEPAWCYYDYDAANGAQYRKLYN